MEPDPGSWWRRQSAQAAFICVCLVLLVAAVYWPVHTHDFIDYDDDLYVTENAIVQQGLTLAGVRWAFTTDHAFNWHPLTWLSHMLDCQWFGRDAGAHHLMNAGWHAANAALLFWLLFRMTGARWRSAMVAVLFALHPLRVESVAWVAERKDVLCLFCWLLTTLAYVHYARQPGRRRYFLVLAAFALGVLSKPMIVTLPFTLLLLDVWPLRRIDLAPMTSGLAPGNLGESIKSAWPAVRKLIVEKIPLFVLSAGLSAITFWIQKEAGAVSAGQGIPLPDRCTNAVVSCLRYLGKLFWPTDLMLPYPHPGSWPLVTVLTGVVLLVALSAIFVNAARRHPYLLVGWLWYLGTLVPVIGLVQVGNQAMADRYTYVSTIGILVMVVWGAADLLEAVPQRRLLLSAAGVLALAGCLIMTTRQIRHWRNSETLFEHAIQVMPDNAIAHFNLGLALATQEKWTAAIEHYSAGLMLRPNDAKGHLNLGRALARQGRLEAAIFQYRQALEIRPDWVDAHLALGMALVQHKNLAGAIIEFSAALKLDPNSAQALNNLGNTRYLQGRPNEAIELYVRALQLNPSSVEATINMALALQAAGQPGDAIIAFERVLRFRPNDAVIHYHLAKLLADSGKAREAVSHYREAIRLKPAWPDPLSHLAWLQATHSDAGIRNGAEALQLAERACALTHRQAPEPLDALAAAYAETGRYADAASTAQQALALANAAGQEALATHIQRRLDLYQAGKPCRAPSPENQPAHL